MSKEKKIPNTQAMRRIWRYMSRFWPYLLVALALSVASNLFALLGPLLSGNAMDAMKGGAGKVNFQAVFVFCALMAGFYVISSVLSYILSRVMISVTQKVVVALRRDVFDKLTRLKVAYFDRVQTGEILSRISYDIDTLASSLSSDLIQVFTSVFTVIGSFILMLTISPLLVLVFVVTIPISIFTTRYLAKKVRPRFKLRSEKLGELNGFSEEIITGHKTIKAYRAEESINERFREKNGAAADAYYRAEYYGTVTGPTAGFINNISIALVSIFGAVLYLAQSITLGQISSFTLYSRKFAGPINEFANILSELQSALAAADRIFRILDEEEEVADNPGAVLLLGTADGLAGTIADTRAVDITGEVEGRNINFSYVEGKPVLRDVSFFAEAGKTIAVVGPTGGGKSTIINLLMRFYDPDSGKITIDGIDILDTAKDSLRRAFSLVLQDTWLFHGTIEENIAYASGNATREEVVAAARGAHIDGYIDALPLGYDSVVDEEGLNISKGQKQLLTIARAMLADAKMLILDEATSNVDTRTERSIQEAMLTLMRGKTCIVIAHRLSTIANADLILVVKDGEITERGKHRELLDAEGFYSQMYRAQYE